MSIKKYLNQKIARRILIIFFLASFLMTTVSTAFILFSQYHIEHKQIITDSKRNLERQIDITSQVLWNLDKPLAKTILESLTNTSAFTFITVNDNEGNIFVSSGEKTNTYTTSIKLPLILNDINNLKQKKIGDIKAYITTSTAKDNIVNNFSSIVFAQVIKSLITSFILLALLYHVLIKHIFAINKHILETSNRQNKKVNKLQLKRAFHNDELQRLVETINSIQKTYNNNTIANQKEKKRLIKEVDKRRIAEKKSRTAHEQLLYVLNSLTKSVFSCNADGEIVFMNHMAMKLLSHHHTVSATTNKKLFLNDIISIKQNDITTSNNIDLVGQATKNTSISKFDAFLAPVTGEEELIPVHITLIPTRSEDKVNKLGFIMVVSDESNRAKYKEMSYMATHDHLTKIYNRSYLTTQINEIVNDKISGYCFAIIDLDKFKNVNDTCGHRAGDELLQLVAKTVPNSLSNNDTFARIGGDEFAILFHSTPSESIKKSKKIISDIESLNFTFDNKVLHISCSIGISCIETSNHTLELIMSHADQACYLVKRNGRGNAKIYDYTDKVVKILPVANKSKVD